MKITEINYTTDPETITERDANAAELAQLKADKAMEAARQKTIAEKELARAALLERLGITADEAISLFQ